MTSSHEYQQIRSDSTYWSRPIRYQIELEDARRIEPDRPVAVDYGHIAFDLLDDVLTYPDDGSPRRTELEHHIQVEKQLREITFPPNTEAIRTGGWALRQSTIDHIATFEALKHLSFLVQFDVEPLDLSPLTRLKEVESIDLGMISHVESLAPLQQLPELRTLSIGTHWLVTAERMREIAEIRTLQTIDVPDISRNPNALAAIELLGRSGSLARVNIAIPLDERETLERIQERLPGIAVHSSKYFRSRPGAFLFALWTALALGSIVLHVHVSGQFALPHAELAPSYRFTHQLATWAIMGGLTVLLSGFLCAYGADPWTAFATISCALVGGVWSSLTAQPAKTIPSILKRFTGRLVGVSVVGVLAAVWYYPMLVEEYLFRCPWWLSTTVLVTTCFFGVRLHAAMIGLCRQRNESGRPVVLSFHDVQRANIDARFRAEDSHLEPTQRGIRLIPIGGVLAVMLVVASQHGPERLIPASVSLTMICMVVGAWSVLVIAMKWWRRVPYFATMIPRPPSRSVQMDGLFRSVAKDFARLIPIMIAVCLFSSGPGYIAPDSPVTRVTVCLFMVTSVVAVCYATTMWALMIRSIWGLAVLLFGSYVAVSTSAIGMVAVGVDVHQTLPTYRFVVAAGALSVAAGLATALARQRFQRLEWARFA